MATFDDYADGAVTFGQGLTDIIPAVPNINVRYFWDSTAGSWQGATGDGTTDDYAVIAAAVTEAATTAGPKIVYFPAGAYKIGTKLAISDVAVIASRHARFIPGVTSMTMVEMQKNSFWSGGHFDAATTTLNFTGIMMLLDGSTNSLWLAAAARAPRVENVDFYGYIGVGGGGTAIKLLADGSSTKVTGAIFRNLRVVSFATGIHLLNGTTGYVNLNQFSNIMMASCADFIHIQSAGTQNNTLNMFNDVSMQPSQASPTSDSGIKITDSDYNQFRNLSCVDSDYFDTGAINIVSGFRNKIDGEGYVGYTVDLGNENSIENEGGPLIMASGIAGDTINRYNAVFLKSDGKYWNTDADAATTMPCRGLCATVAGASNVAADAKMRVITQGKVYNSAWNWGTIGGPIYASTDPTTTSGLTETAVSGSGDQLQYVGYVINADTIYVDPQLPVVEIA